MINDVELMNIPVNISTHRSHRQKRDLNQNNPYIIEVLVVVDQSMQKFHRSMGTDLGEYVLTLMSTANDIFADPSIGSMVSISVVEVLNLNHDLGAQRFRHGKESFKSVFLNFSEIQ